MFFLMYNLYQSPLRNDINHKVFQKPMFEIKLFGKLHKGIIKEMKLGPLKFKWFQVLGVVLPDDIEYVKKEVARIQKEYGDKFGCIMFQRWIINPMVQFENVSHRSKQFKEDMRNMRLNLRRWLTTATKMKLSIRENMPQANIVYEISKSDEQLLNEMNSGCKERVKKSIKKWATFRVASVDEYDQYYQDRKRLAWSKWFNIIPYESYKKLVDYIRENDCGDVFIAEIDGEIIAWSICIYDEHRIIYHSGFATREKKFRNIGAHHFLKFKIFWWARKKGLTYCDMLGGAPTGFHEHPLAWVSKFKEALGGIKIEYYGNYDIVLNPLLYKLFAWRQFFKKTNKTKKKK